MRPPLAARLSRALVACYPPRWKQRYREEMLDVLDQHQASPRTVLSLAGGALTAHLDPSYRMGRPVIKNKAVRALLIAAAGCMAAIALVYGVFTYTDVNQLIGNLVWHPGHAEGDVALVLTPDQRLLATLEGGEPDTAVVTLMSVGPAGLRQLSSFEGGVTVAIAPDGHLVATSGYGGEAALWNVARPRHPALLAILRPGSSNALWGEAFSPDSKLLAAAYGGTTALWDVARPAEPRLLTVLDAHVGPVTHADIAFSPDGHLLALANGNGQVTIWDVTRPARAAPVATITVRDGYFQAREQPGQRLIHRHDHLAARQAPFHRPVRRHDLRKAEHLHRLRLVPPALRLADHLLQRNVGQRKPLGAEYERAAVEAELHPGRQVGDRVEPGYRLQPAKKSELAHPPAGPDDPHASPAARCFPPGRRRHPQSGRARAPGPPAPRRRSGRTRRRAYAATPPVRPNVSSRSPSRRPRPRRSPRPAPART